jgi:hypothetical protein
MRTIRQHLTYANGAATLAILLAAGGAAWAASSSGRTIHACFKSHGGALRIAAHCKHGERALSWNQIGPRGVRGLTGIKGAAGAKGAAGKTGLGLTGPAGPSDVYAGGAATGTLTSAYTSYGTLPVPAGSYLIEAKVTFIPESKASKMTCAIAPGTSFTTPWDSGIASGEPNVDNVLSLIGAKTFASTQTIELVCKASAGTGKVEDAHLVAIKTSLLHGEPPVA